MLTTSLFHRIKKYKCPFCSFLTLILEVYEDHVKQEHPLWRLPPSGQEVDCSALQSNPWNDTIPRTSVPGLSFAPQMDLIPTSSTSHLHPDWLDKIKRNFHDIVIAKCSHKVREAVAKNDKINKELIDETISHLMDVHGHSTKPTIAEMSEVVFEMAFQYPTMFKDEEGHGYGLGGGGGLQGLANQMLDKLRKRQAAAKIDASLKGENIKQPTRQKGKKASIYGKIVLEKLVKLIWQIFRC